MRQFVKVLCLDWTNFKPFASLRWEHMDINKVIMAQIHKQKGNNNENLPSHSHSPDLLQK